MGGSLRVLSTFSNLTWFKVSIYGDGPVPWRIGKLYKRMCIYTRSVMRMIIPHCRDEPMPAFHFETSHSKSDTMRQA